MDGEATIRLEVTDDCHGCGVCVGVCPKKAISMVEGGIDPRALINRALCDLCRVCQDVCPVEAILEPYPPSWRPDVP
jgi:ferredoxin